MKMKFLSICIALFGMLFISCSQDDEVYSCDPDANEWAKENLDDIHKMTRSEWLAVPDADFQKAAYAAFSPEQKYVFWKEKMNEVLALDWNNKEKEHISSLIDYLDSNPEIFDRELTKGDEIFIYKWKTYAEEELKWEANVIYAATANPNKMLSKEGNLELPPKSTLKLKTGNETDGGNICECSDIGDCSYTGLPSYVKPKCSKALICKAKYCGLFWKNYCDGMCSYS